MNPNDFFEEMYKNDPDGWHNSTEITDPNLLKHLQNVLDLGKIQPYHEGTGTHAYSKRYEIDGKRYEFVYALSDETETPMVSLIEKVIPKEPRTTLTIGEVKEYLNHRLKVKFDDGKLSINTDDIASDIVDLVNDYPVHYHIKDGSTHGKLVSLSAKKKNSGDKASS